MDPLTYMLMSRSSGNIIYDILLIVLILPFIAIIVDKSKNRIHEFIENINFYDKNKSIEFVGWENITGGQYNFDFPFPMMAICYDLIKSNKAKNTRFFNEAMNGANSRWDPVIHTKEMHLIISNYQKIYYDKDINLEFRIVKLTDGKEVINHVWKVMLIINTTQDINFLTLFVNKCILNYNNYITAKNKNKIYHFIFQGKNLKETAYEWKSSILSDLDDESNKNFETFDTMYSVHKNNLISDINRLKDIEYYKKSGAKRKKGYLFYGPPGCGKTSSVIAMANYDKRHILEIPMSRIKTNSDIEEILNITNIHNVNFKKEEIIILFDEIDTGLDSIQKRDSERDRDQGQGRERDLGKDNESTENIKDNLLKTLVNSKCENDLLPNRDKICIGTILSRFDGVGSYNGIIIIATTNCIDKISPAVYRHGRLNPIYFDYMQKEDIRSMIEGFYKVKLTEKQLIDLPSHSDKLAPSSLRQYLEDNINSSENLLKYLKNLQ